MKSILQLKQNLFSVLRKQSVGFERPDTRGFYQWPDFFFFVPGSEPSKPPTCAAPPCRETRA